MNRKTRDITKAFIESFVSDKEGYDEEFIGYQLKELFVILNEVNIK